MIFNETFRKISWFFPNFQWIFLSHFSWFFLKKWPKSTFSKKSKNQNQFKNHGNLVSKILLDSLPKINFQVKIKISWPKKSIFQGKLRKKTGQPFGDIHMMNLAVNFQNVLKMIGRPLNYEDFDFEILHVWKFTEGSQITNLRPSRNEVSHIWRKFDHLWCRM